MPRYFIEVAYKGTAYAGFQVQQNAVTIQSEVEKALSVFFRQEFQLTCSSRTDAGVHARQNYFHMDAKGLPGDEELGKIVYNLNAILPGDIVIKRIFNVADEAHSRFDPKWREYRYYVYQNKDPFLSDRAYFFPYSSLSIDRLNEVAAAIMQYTDFTSFSKRNTQVKTYNCTIFQSEWLMEGEMLVYVVRGNRFLRGMVRGLVGTMLKAGTGKLSVEEFKEIIDSRDCSNADFSVPPQGLFLYRVEF